MKTESTVEIIKVNNRWKVSIVTKGIIKLGNSRLPGRQPTTKRGFSTKEEAINYAVEAIRANLHDFTD